MKLSSLTKIAGMAFAMSALCLGMTSCGDSDNNDDNNKVVGADMWGEVLRGDNMTLQFYPDHFAYYWEYTFDAAANPGTGLIIEGEFPEARFLSYNVYDDDEQTSYVDQQGYKFSLMDTEIKADAGYKNPFVDVAAGKKQKYTIYVLPTNAPASLANNCDNVIWFDAAAKKVCTILRYYIPEGDIKGSVGMPLVKGLNLTTGKAVAAPKRELSGLRGDMELPGAAFTASDNLLFFRAPFSFAYPNGPAEYCYSRNLLEKNEVMMFNFKAPSYPKSAAEYGKTDMRYWSVCVGNDQTYTPLAISDYQTKIDENGFANYILVDKGSDKYAQIKQIADNNNINVLEWDGDSWNKGVMILYRNMVFDTDYAHSLRKLDPVGPGVDVTAAPQKYICVLALGQWGATGRKFTADAFIAANGKINLRQQAQ